MDLNDNQPPQPEAPSQAVPPPDTQPTPPPSSQAAPPSSSGTEPQKTSVLAILALVFGIIIPIVGVILGIIALVKIKKNPNLKGKGLATAGLIVGCVFMILPIILAMIGSLAYFGVMSPDTMLPSKCIITGGFSCSDYMVTSDGTIQFSAYNGLGIDLDSATVTTGNECTPAGVTWNNGETLSFSCAGTPGNIGESFSYDLTIKYVRSGETIERTATGSISGRYE